MKSAECPDHRDFRFAQQTRGEGETEARKTLVFVNNRLEGNALSTIAAVMEEPGRMSLLCQ